jgi:ABC-2 type transport system ATP-binding protein
MSVIHAEGVTKRYGAQMALKGIELEVEAGAIVGLLGPNGAGKTTLLEILEGLRAPSGGRVRVLGLDPTVAPRRLRERIGVQLQATATIPELTVAETLRLFAAFYPRVLPLGEVLGRVALGEQAQARVGSLSGGQRQRLALGLAMQHDPELLLLDEPTTGLDPVARRALHEIVRDLRERGKTIVLVSHYVEEIEQLANRVVVMSAGTILADGTPGGLRGGRASLEDAYLTMVGVPS